MATVHVGDSGVLFMITVQDEVGVVNLTTVTAITLFLQKPDKSYISRPCDTVNAVTGLIRYVSSSGDFDQAGRWRIQVVVRFADGTVKHSDVGTLTVDKNIPL